MSIELFNCMYNIDEEDLLINDINFEEKNRVKIYIGEYVDTKIDLVFYENQLLFNQELENRIKHNNKYLPVILGKSSSSCLSVNEYFNYCLILEKPNFNNLYNIIKRKELKIPDILNLIKNLIQMFDFFNTRNLFFGILHLNEIFYDKITQELKIVKYPLDFSYNEIKSEDNLKKLFEKEYLILLAPEVIKCIKMQQNFELNSITESWNLGMLVYEILENKPLYEIDDYSKDFTLEILMNIDNQTISNKINGLNHNQNIKNLLKKLLKTDKRQRLCTKLIKQTFLKRIVLNENAYNNGKDNSNTIKANEETGKKNGERFDFLFKLSHIQNNKTNNDISVIEIARDNYNVLNKSDFLYEDINQSSTKLLKENESDMPKDILSLNKHISTNSQNSKSIQENENSNSNDKRESNIPLNLTAELKMQTENLINFDKQETFNYSKKEKFISEKNSNNNIKTEDQTINDFKQMTNNTIIIDKNQKVKQSNSHNNINDNTLKLTNSDFDNKDKGNIFAVLKEGLKEQNLLDKGIQVHDTNNLDLDIMNKQKDLIVLNDSIYEKNNFDDLIKISESSIYEEISENINNTNKCNIKEDFYTIEDLKNPNKKTSEAEQINKNINFNQNNKKLNELKINQENQTNSTNISENLIYNKPENKEEFNLYKDEKINFNYNDLNVSRTEYLNIENPNCISKNLELLQSNEVSSNLIYEDQDIFSQKTYIDTKEDKSISLKNSISRMEKLTLEFFKTNSNNFLEEIEDLIKKHEASIDAGNLEPFENISMNLWESFMLIAFKYLENDDIKNHYLISKILYHNYDKIIKERSINIALAKFHFAKSQKDYNSNFPLSLNLFKESIDLVNEMGESNTQLGLTIKFYLGTLYDDMGMYDESVELLRDVLQNQIKVFSSEDNLFVARTYNCLGIAEDNRGNLRPAREFYQKAYRIFKFLSYGMETVDSAKVLNNLAGIYYRWEDYSTSLKLYMVVLDVYEKKFGTSNNYVAITFNNIGNCYLMLGDNKKALNFLNKALENFCELFGQSHPQTAMTYKNLGDLYLNLNEKNKALEMFNACVYVFKDKYGEDNDVYLSTLGKIKKLKLANN